MKLSLDWMNDFAPLKEVGLDAILKKIAISVCEIDAAEPFRPELDFVKIVKVKSLDKHPSADKLQIARAFDGTSEFQIVTGATNVKAGDLVPLAIPGAKLGDKEILESELRGVKSSGMFCSEKELSLSEEGDGVWILNGIEGAEVGKTIRSFYITTILYSILIINLSHTDRIFGVISVLRENSPLNFDCLSRSIPSDLFGISIFRSNFRSYWKIKTRIPITPLRFAEFRWFLPKEKFSLDCRNAGFGSSTMSWTFPIT